MTDLNDLHESGWDEAGNCVKCGEAGRCYCGNHFITGLRHNEKPVRIKRVPFTSPMFKRYSPDKFTIYYATGERLKAVGKIDFILGLLKP